MQAPRHIFGSVLINMIYPHDILTTIVVIIPLTYIQAQEVR